jgi:serine/threonine protein kinase
VILVDGRGAVLFDFGVAATRREQVFGFTWQYWPPGVPAGTKGADPDLFAVGIVMCELLTGDHPYPKRNPHGGKRPDVSNLPPGLAEVLARAIDPNPSMRFETAAEFSDALAPFVDTTRKITVSRRGRYRRVEQLISEGKLDEAEDLCLPEWKRLTARIERAEELAKRVVDLGGRDRRW